MSFGAMHPTYQPVNKNMLSMVAYSYPRLRKDELLHIFEILTHRLSTETLLFVAVVDMLARFLYNRGDGPSYGLGAGIKLSGIMHRTEGKMQTRKLKLLHDVIVEMQMAGYNFALLQKYMWDKHGASFVFYHSCGSALVPNGLIDTFYQRSFLDQQKRTLLDWKGLHITANNWNEMVEKTDYTREEVHVIENIFAVAEACIAFIPTDICKKTSEKSELVLA